MLVCKLPTAELGFLLRQHQQAALLTTYPEIVLIILEKRPDIRGVQVE